MSSYLTLKPTLNRKVNMARHQTAVTPEISRLALNCLDLTSLSGTETSQDIINLCHQALTYRLASVCVFPDKVSLAAQILKGTDVNVATVINFPTGVERTNSNITANTSTTLADITAAIQSGATQIDIVYPRANISGFASDILSQARKACPDHVTLKSIMETAAYRTREDLEDAILVAINAGVDCVKTSTGKHENGGATLEAAAVILDTIQKSKRDVGIKISGGLRTADQCAQYIALKQIFSGSASVNPEKFRFGGSSILDELLATLPIQNQLPRNKNIPPESTPIY